MRKEVIITLIALVLLVIGGSYILMGQKNRKVNPTVSMNTYVTPEERIATTETPEVTGPIAKVAEEISLTVSQPINGQVVKSPTITVNGTTVPNADVTINDTDLKADVKGNFSRAITLDEGENTIIIVATDDQGKIAEKDIVVTYDSGQTYQ